MDTEARGPVVRLVQTAAAQTTLAGIGEMLRVVAEELQSWGAVIWMAAPGADFDGGTGRLFVLGYWVPDEEIKVWHELTFDSMAGRVLLSQRPDQAADGDERIAKPIPRFFEQSKTRRVSLAPMTMADGARAVLEVYRQQDDPFSDAQMALLEQMATTLPLLYAVLTDRVGFALQDRISAIRREFDSGDITDTHVAVKKMISAIDEVFHCLEVSIFLRDEIADEPDVFRLFEYLKAWPGVWADKAAYQPNEGATGYSIASGKAVRIVDLAHYKDDEKWIAKEYPGLLWSNSLHILDRAKEHFDISDPESSPPVSFVCAPIRSGNRKLGAIRCCGSQRNPYYFDSWQVRLLEAVAARIGVWWHGVFRERQKDDDTRAWKRLMDGFQTMNRYVQRTLGKHTWDPADFYREAMRLAHEVIPFTDNSDVRLVEGETLLTCAVYGRDWERAVPFKTKRWPLHPPDSAAALLVVQKGGVTIHNKIEEAPLLHRIFPDTKKFIMAPILAEDRMVGVLCIRSKSPRPFPEYAELVAGLLGQQLGLYHYLVTQIRNLQNAERKNKDLIKTQTQTIGDVPHQVKSPILSAYRTAQLVLQNKGLPLPLRQDVLRLRSLTNKVSRVVRNMGVFAALSEDKPIQLKKQVLEREKLIRMLTESRDDHNATIDVERRIRFALDEKGLAEVAGKDRVGKVIEVDVNLIEQCLNNLLDNAAKYSYDNTTVQVSGGVQSKGEEVYVSVVNQGFEVKPDDVAKLIQRGYRADAAIWSTGEGSGIGLWIVDKIMKAHGGRLMIIPTNKYGLTDVRLVLPIRRGLSR